MFKDVKSYRNTTIHWSKTQGEIMRLLEQRGIKETRFTNLSGETMARAGVEMEADTTAIMVEFFKNIQDSNGVGGTLPIRIVIPNIPDEEKYRNQAYRIFFWYLKTKFEAIDTGLIEFEQEFMPHIAIGKGSGIGTLWQAFKQRMLPAITSGQAADIKMLSNPSDKTGGQNE